MYLLLFSDLAQNDSIKMETLLTFHMHVLSYICM